MKNQDTISPSMEHKVVLITGASAGIGKALAIYYASSGHNLALISRNYTKLLNLQKEIQSKYETNVIIFSCDIGDSIHFNEIFTQILDYFHRVDICILNAGISQANYFESFDTEIMNKIFQTNTLGLINNLSVISKYFINNDINGKIAAISSLADARAVPGASCYNASKSALSIMLESANIELDKYGIKIITVKPAFVATNMITDSRFPTPFVVSPEKAAQIISKGIARNKDIIKFPHTMSLVSSLVLCLPFKIYKTIIRIVQCLSI